MRSVLARFLHRPGASASTASDIELSLPFPLSFPTVSESHREAPLSVIERAFYEGSVMIW